MTDGWYWFRCPRCGTWGEIDDDQARARVSIECPEEMCAFHETGTVTPLIPVGTPVSRDQIFEVRRGDGEGE